MGRGKLSGHHVRPCNFLLHMYCMARLVPCAGEGGGGGATTPTDPSNVRSIFGAGVERGEPRVGRGEG